MREAVSRVSYVVLALGFGLVVGNHYGLEGTDTSTLGVVFITIAGVMDIWARRGLW